MNSSDIFKFLCETCEYRFFIGQPEDEYSLIFNKFSNKYIHYIPTISAEIALNIAIGSSFTGTVPVMFVNNYDLVNLNFKLLQLSDIKNITILFITNKNVELNYNKIFFKDLSTSTDKDIFLKSQPNILVIEEGDIVV